MSKPNFDRTLNPRARKRVVGYGDDVVLARNFRDRFQIDQLQERITRRLDPDHARVRFDLPLKPAGVR